MTRFLPTDELRFLMELSIEPVAQKARLLPPVRSSREDLAGW